MSAKKQKRFSREDWLELGFSQLVQLGLGGLTVEALCSAAGRTRGSFYHHFEDHAAFVAALVARWRQLQTKDVVVAVEATGVLRHHALQDLASRLDHRLDVAMRRWGFVDQVVGQAVRAVDAERVDYLTKLYLEEDDLNPDAARLAAEGEYALFVGLQVLWPDYPAERGTALKALISIDGLKSHRG